MLSKTVYLHNMKIYIYMIWKINSNKQFRYIKYILQFPNIHKI